MKSVTASEARKNWFRLLDDVAAGEVVQIRRGRKNLVLRCEITPEECVASTDYHSLISASAIDEADRWGWDWSEEGLVTRDYNS